MTKLEEGCWYFLDTIPNIPSRYMGRIENSAIFHVFYPSKGTIQQSMNFEYVSTHISPIDINKYLDERKKQIFYINKQISTIEKSLAQTSPKFTSSKETRLAADKFIKRIKKGVITKRHPPNIKTIKGFDVNEALERFNKLITSKGFENMMKGTYKR